MRTLATCLTLFLASSALAQEVPAVWALSDVDATYVCAAYGKVLNPQTAECDNYEVDMATLNPEACEDYCGRMGLLCDAAKIQCAPYRFLKTQPGPRPPMPKLAGTIELDGGELYVEIDHNHRAFVVPEQLGYAAQALTGAPDPLAAAYDAGLEVQFTE